MASNVVGIKSGAKSKAEKSDKKSKAKILDKRSIPEKKAKTVDKPRHQGASGRVDLPLFEPENLVVVNDPKHPLFDKRAMRPINEGFIKNIMARGVMEPILVRRNGDTVEVVAGRRRTLAAIEANKRIREQGGQTIRVLGIWKHGDDANLLGMMIAENAHREAETIPDKAEKAARLLDLGKTKAEVADDFDCTVTALDGWLKFHDMDPKLQEAVRNNEIAYEVALTLVGVKREKQVVHLEKLKEAGTTKGSKGKKAGEAATGTIRQRVRSIVEVRALKVRFEEAKGKGIPSGQEVLDWILGDDNAIDAKWSEKKEKE